MSIQVSNWGTVNTNNKVNCNNSKKHYFKTNAMQNDSVSFKAKDSNETKTNWKCIAAIATAVITAAGICYYCLKRGRTNNRVTQSINSMNNSTPMAPYPSSNLGGEFTSFNKGLYGQDTLDITNPMNKLDPTSPYYEPFPNNYSTGMSFNYTGNPYF